MRIERQPLRQSLVEELPALHVHCRCDHQPQLVDQVLLEQRLGEGDAPVHADITAGPLLQIGDELGEPTVDDRGVRHIWLGVVEVTTNFSTPLMKLANGS